jgi:hypothetical protein
MFRLIYAHLDTVWFITGLCLRVTNFFCRGNGYEDGYKMTFIGQPSDVANAINGMKFFVSTLIPLFILLPVFMIRSIPVPL